jgi:hypothetical protein
MNHDTTPTPRTDEARQKAFSNQNADQNADYLGYVYMANHAEKLERELTEKTNEVARLIRENAKLRRFVHTLKTIAETGEEITSRTFREEYKQLASAPEEAVSKCKCDYTSIIRATLNGYTYDQCSKCGKKFGESFEKEPVIQDSRITEPAPEWRCFVPDEVIEKHADSPLAQWSNLECLRYLRDEIQELKKKIK